MKTIFITGGTGYIGSEFVDVALGAGHRVQVLTRSKEMAKQLEEKGAEPIIGDIMEGGNWQEKASRSEWIVHLASPPTWGKKVTAKVAQNFQRGHYSMTERLFDTLQSKHLRKAIFIAGTSYYGNTGTKSKVSEGFKGVPQGWGPFIAPSVEAIPKYITKGLPIVTAFPGQVYGPGSWFEQLFLDPLYAHKKITSLKGYDTMFSPIHVRDCARAILHLLEDGEVGGSYFLVDNSPTPSSELGKLAATKLRVQLKTRKVPRWLCQLLLGPVLTEYAIADSYLSNQALLSTGFQLKYPSIKEGIPNVVANWLVEKEQLKANSHESFNSH